MIKSYIVGPGSLVLGAPGSPGEIAPQVTSCKVTPNTDVGDPTPVLSGEELPGDRTTTWTLNGSWLQDISDTGITTYSLEHAGETVPWVYIPNNDEERSISGNLIVDPTEIGGDVKARATSDFEFGVVGTPALGDVAP